jgi:hypothetical protein
LQEGRGEGAEGDLKNTFSEYMKDATLMIQKPRLLVSAVNMIDELPLTQGDTKGDLYEYLLSKLTTAGINGQFRTPRHIIRLMVDLVIQGNEEEAITSGVVHGSVARALHFRRRQGGPRKQRQRRSKAAMWARPALPLFLPSRGSPSSCARLRLVQVTGQLLA